MMELELSVLTKTKPVLMVTKMMEEWLRNVLLWKKNASQVSKTTAKVSVFSKT